MSIRESQVEALRGEKPTRENEPKEDTVYYVEMHVEFSFRLYEFYLTFFHILRIGN